MRRARAGRRVAGLGAGQHWPLPPGVALHCMALAAGYGLEGWRVGAGGRARCSAARRDIGCHSAVGLPGWSGSGGLEARGLG